jgi:hypothetical protein
MFPPQSLEWAVWPFVDEWLEWFDAGTASTPAARRLRLQRQTTQAMRGLTAVTLPSRASYVYYSNSVSFYFRIP